jgi:hypothetical protein
MITLDSEHHSHFVLSTYVAYRNTLSILPCHSSTSVTYVARIHVTDVTNGVV